jgi:hypothetical protein
MALCVSPFKACQRPDEKLDYAFDFLLELSRKWEANTQFTAGVRVRPSTSRLQTGFEYISDGGQTNGASEPIWPTEDGETVTDGSITWTAAELSLDSLRDRIHTAVWSADTGITVSEDEIGDDAGQQLVSAWLEGGDSGETYEVTVLVTTVAGLQFERVIELRIRA